MVILEEVEIKKLEMMLLRIYIFPMMGMGYLMGEVVVTLKVIQIKKYPLMNSIFTIFKKK